MKKMFMLIMISLLFSTFAEPPAALLPERPWLEFKLLPADRIGSITKWQVTSGGGELPPELLMGTRDTRCMVTTASLLVNGLQMERVLQNGKLSWRFSSGDRPLLAIPAPNNGYLLRDIRVFVDGNAWAIGNYNYDGISSAALDANAIWYNASKSQPGVKPENEYIWFAFNLMSPQIFQFDRVQIPSLELLLTIRNRQPHSADPEVFLNYHGQAGHEPFLPATVLKTPEKAELLKRLQTEVAIAQMTYAAGTTDMIEILEKDKTLFEFCCQNLPENSLQLQQKVNADLGKINAALNHFKQLEYEIGISPKNR